MNSKVVSLRSVESVKKIYEALKTSHHGFPVTNLRGQLVGLIPKKFLLILLEQRQFYSHPNQKYHVMNGYIKKLLKQNINASKYLDTSNMQNADASQTQGYLNGGNAYENGNGYEVQSYLEKMISKSGKAVNHDDIELMGLKRLKTQQLKNEDG
jgi:hypothetical protein